jgi:hypothetical protein
MVSAENEPVTRTLGTKVVKDDALAAYANRSYADSSVCASALVLFFFCFYVCLTDICVLFFSRVRVNTINQVSVVNHYVLFAIFKKSGVDTRKGIQIFHLN